MLMTNKYDRVKKEKQYRDILSSIQKSIDKLEKIASETAFGEDKLDDKVWVFCRAWEGFLFEFDPFE